ncbi:uncharacterized protein UTRI_00504_B [Ustilago trichophora]|uniref:Uncharacterized protein n=1 Tax=Ustilago trichophora TaxID=86804 RepID=A0A5C3DSY7_9BASI|nr:uncharacterized protein UTRI_00504_B [Ustilago trichophora]
MFFDGIGIDLHFIHEGDTSSTQASRIFTQYQNAGQRLRSDGKTLVGAFLLNEVGSSLSQYESKITPADGGDPVSGETVALETGHTSEIGRFVARVWRAPSVFETPNASQDSGACQIMLRAVRRTTAGDVPDILCEAPLIEFPAGQSSVFFEAGAIFTVPESDIAITVVRLSKKQVINVTFKYQAPTGLQSRFPGVPVSHQPSSIDHADLRAVRSGSDDERLLQPFIAAYIAQTEVKDVQDPLPQSDDASTAAPAVLPSNDVPYGGDLQAILPPDARAAPSPAEALAAPFNAGTSLSDIAQAQAFESTSTSMVDNCLSSAKESNNQASPPLAHRAWANIGSAIANIASTIAPARTSTAPSITPSATSTSPKLQDAQPASATTMIHEEQSGGRIPQSVPKTRARSHSEGGSGSQLAASLNELIGGIVNVLDDAQENQWVDAGGHSSQPNTDLEGALRACQMVEPSAQPTLTEEPRTVGVSYHEWSHPGTPTSQVCSSSMVIQPLTLPMGSLTPADSPLQPSAADIGNTGTVTVAGTAQSSNESNLITEDVQMEETSKTSEQIPQTYSPTVPLTSASEVFPSTTAAQPAASIASSNDDTQFVLCSIGTQTDGLEGQPAASGSSSREQQPLLSSATSDVPLAVSQPLVLSSSSSDAPLAAGSCPPKTQSEAANASGTMVLATMTQSPHAVPSVAGNTSACRRSGRGRSGASPAPSAATSARSTFTPSSQRMAEVFRYLMDKVLDDKDKDELQCEKLAKVRAAHATKFEAVKRQYEQDLIANNVALEVVRAGASLKRDTLRLLRSQYRSQVQDSRFRAKTFVDSRIGSNRRSRSLSRGQARSRSPTFVGSRMATPVASEVPESMVKRERIDLTKDADIDDGGSVAGASRRTVRRGASTSRSLGEALGLDRVARKPACNVGNVSDLMQNPPPSRTKRSLSCIPGKDNVAAMSRSATSSASRVPVDSMQVDGDARENTTSHTVEQWRARVERPRAVGKAPTDAGMLPPPPPHNRGITPDNPIVIHDDEEADIHRRLVRQGKKRAISRPRSVRTQTSHTTSHNMRVEQTRTPISAEDRVGSIPAAALVVRDDAARAEAERDDDSSDEEEELPLFMGDSQRGGRARSAGTEFSTLFSPDSLA